MSPACICIGILHSQESARAQFVLARQNAPIIDEEHPKSPLGKGKLALSFVLNNYLYLANT